jgi:fatty acid desaturase
MNIVKHVWSKEILIENSKLKELDNYHSLFALFSDISICIIFSFLTDYYWSIFGYFLYPITLIIIGSKMRGLTALIHEYSHDTLAKSQKLNDWIGLIAGILIFTSIKNYKLKHLADHHPYLGDVIKDPDAMFKAELGIDKKMSKDEIWQKIFLYPFTIKYLYENTISIFHSRFRAIYKARNDELRKDYYIITSVLCLVTLICFHFGWIKFLMLYWLIPCFTSYQQFLWFTFLAEHYPLTNLQNELDIELSRNRKGNWFEQILLDNHGVSYHGIHHDNPKIPWWNLKKSFELKLQDPKFKAVQDQYGGGLFTKGVTGAPSMIEQIFKYMLIT